MALIGVDYGGADESPVYMILCAAAGGISILSTIKYFIRHRGLGTHNILLFIIPILIYIGGAFDGAFLDTSVSLIEKKQLFFFAFSYPGICVGCHLAHENSLHKIAKWLDILILIIAGGLVLTVPQMLTDACWSLGGTSYQVMAYAGGTAFGLNLCFFLFGDEMELFSIFSTKKYRIVRIILLCALGLCTLLSGGRGGALLMILNGFLMILLVGKVRQTVFYVILTIVLIIAVSSSLDQLGLSSRFDTSIERTFQYLDADKGIDMENGSSNRDVVYEKALDIIIDKPFFGHGMYGAYEQFDGTSPHNIFLEVMIQGGMLYMALFLFLLSRLYKKLKRFISISKGNYLIIPIVTYPCVMLLFSGSYMTDVLFWFSVSFLLVYSYQIDPDETECNQEHIRQQEKASHTIPELA